MINLIDDRKKRGGEEIVWNRNVFKNKYGTYRCIFSASGLLSKAPIIHSAIDRQSYRIERKAEETENYKHTDIGGNKGTN